MAIRSLSGPFWGRAVLCTAGDADCTTGIPFGHHGPLALAMTVRGRPVPLRPGAAIFRVPSAERHGGLSLQEEAISMKRRGAAASRPPYGDGSQNHDKMCCVILYKML